MAFFAQRSLFLGAALLAVQMAYAAGLPHPFLAAIPMLVLWTPTTLAILYSRYLSRAWDDQPVVLISGLTLSRRNFRVWMAAQAAEGVIGGALIVSMALALLASPSPAAWLAPVIALGGTWAMVARVFRVRLARGIVRLAEFDPHGAIEAVRPVLSYGPLAWSLAPSARLLRVQAFMLLGDRDAAVAECDRVRRRGAVNARAWRALLTAEEGAEQADAVLQSTPRLIGEAWHQVLLHALQSLLRSDRASFDATTTQRAALVERLGPRARALNQLLEAARSGLDGPPQRLSRATAERVAFARHIWPRVYTLATEGRQAH